MIGGRMKGLSQRTSEFSLHFAVRPFGMDILWQEGAHSGSCR